MSVTLELFNAINEGDVDAARVLLKIATAEDVNCQDQVNFFSFMQFGKSVLDPRCVVISVSVFNINIFYDRLENRF